MSLRPFSMSKVWALLTFLSFVIGMSFVYWTGENMKQSGFENRETQKKIESRLAVTSFKKELDKFALLVMGIRNQIETIDHIPSAKELQSFLQAQLKGIDFYEPTVISYLDTNHVFQYSVTSTTVFANELAGENVAVYRDSKEISRLNHLMDVDELLLFPPLNLVEGWVGIPLCFRLQKEGITVGYFAPIIDFKSIIDEVYHQPTSKDLVYKFSFNNEFFFDRHSVYNGSKVYNNLSDEEFYQNYQELVTTDFLENSFSRFGAHFHIGVAHKEAFQLSAYQNLLLYSWYFIITFFFSVIWILTYWRKQKREELKIKRDQLISYNEALERFTFAASHDLKEPLRNIGSFSSLIQRRYSDVIDESGMEYLGFIRRNISKMNTLLEDLSQYAKLINEAKVPKEKIAFDDVLMEVKESVFTSLKESNIQLNIDDTFAEVYINKVQIYQLFQNLVSNAIKFNDKEYRKVHIGSEKLNGDYLFFVKDNGIGVEEEFHHKIFETFQQLNKRDYIGSGLGLSICKKIVEQNGGKIWLESEKGIGTTFYFSLPSSS